MGSALQSNMGPIFRATQQQSGCDKRPARSGRLPHVGPRCRWRACYLIGVVSCTKHHTKFLSALMCCRRGMLLMLVYW